MEPFFLLYLLLVFFGMISSIVDDRYLKYFIAVVFILLLSYFIGFRVDNLDYDNYKFYFESAPDIVDVLIGNKVYVHYVEPMYAYMSSIFKIFSNEFNFFLFLYAIFSVVLVIYGYSRLSSSYILLSLIYFSVSFYSMYFTQIRSGLALSISIICVSLYIEKRYKQFLTLSMLAIFVHVSSLLLLFLPLISKINFTLSKLLVVMSLSFVFCTVNVFEVLIPFLNSISGEGFVMQKITLYVMSGRDNVVNSFFSVTNFLLIGAMFVILFIYRESNPKKSVFLCLLVLSFTLGNLFSFYGDVAVRFYRFGFIVIPFAMMIYSKNLLARLFLVLLSLLLFLYYGHFNKEVPVYDNYFYWPLSI